MCLSTLVHYQYENEFLASRGVGLGEGLWVVSLVRRTLKSKHKVIGMDNRNVLVVIEGPMVAVGKKICQYYMVPVGNGRGRQLTKMYMEKGVRRANQANSRQLFWAGWPSSAPCMRG